MQEGSKVTENIMYKYHTKKKCLKISYVHSKIYKEKFKAALYGRNEELLWKRQWRKS